MKYPPARARGIDLEFVNNSKAAFGFLKNQNADWLTSQTSGFAE
jgi:hypothetical protein